MERVFRAYIRIRRIADDSERARYRHRVYVKERNAGSLFDLSVFTAGTFVENHDKVFDDCAPLLLSSCQFFRFTLLLHRDGSV